MVETVDELTLDDVGAALREGRKLVFVSVLIFTAIGFLILVLSPKTYRAEAVLLPVSSDSSGSLMAGISSQLGGVASLAGLSVGQSDRKIEGFETLRSRSLVEQFINENKLLPHLYPQRWDSAEQRWKVAPDEVPTVWEAAKKFRKDVLSIEQETKTGLVTIGVQWRDPEVAAQWANDLIRRVNDRLRTRAIGQSERNLQYLREQADKTSIFEVRQALYRLIEGEIKNSMLARGTEEFAFKTIDAAVAPQRPSWPVTVPLLVGGPLVGLLLGCLYVVTLGLMKRARLQSIGG